MVIVHFLLFHLLWAEWRLPNAFCPELFTVWEKTTYIVVWFYRVSYFGLFLDWLGKRSLPVVGKVGYSVVPLVN